MQRLGRDQRRVLGFPDDQVQGTGVSQGNGLSVGDFTRISTAFDKGLFNTLRNIGGGA
ncbi:hypothetical protein D3C73_1024990 [compost metagenome]